MKNLSRLKPHLRPHRISHDGTRIIIEDRKAQKSVSLSMAQEPIIALLDGIRTVQEIVERLMATVGKVSFRQFLSALQALDEAGLFTEPLGLAPEKTAAAPSERAEAFFMRPLFQTTVINRMRVPATPGPWNLIALIALSCVIAAIAGDTIIYWFNHFSTRDFMRLRDLNGNPSYARALPALVLMASGLMLIKGLAKALLLLTATGQFFYLRLRLHPFAVGLDVSDISAQSMSRSRVLIYFAGLALINIAVAAILPTYVHDAELVRTFETLAVLMTLLELDPYRRSDLTVVIDRFFRDDSQTRGEIAPTDTRRMTAYLKNRALFSAATGTKGFGGEARLVAYSSVSLLWTVGFAIFALDLLSSNYPNLVLAVQMPAPLLERISAAAVLAILAGVFGTLFFDLASTIARNVLFPLLTPYLRLLQSVNTKEVADFDRPEMAKRLQTLTFFDDLAPLSVREMVATSQLKRFRKGTRLIIQGDPGHELFVLLEGRVGVHRRDETGLDTRVCGLEAGAVFGEIALIRECTRTADVVAEADILALVVEKATFKKLVETSQYIDDFSKILDKIALGHFLSSVPLFKDIPIESMGVFRERGQFERKAKDQDVIVEGEKDRALYLVLRGRLSVARAGKTVGDLKQGDFFGEIALLSSTPRTATVRTLDDCLLLRLDANAFWDVLSGNLALASGLEMVAEQRQPGQRV